ncbi:MAG: SpaA isopeptide-forming pilin-related protein [Coprococcus comes]
MKSNTKKRLIAFMLCMVLVLSSTISAFADDLDTQTQDQTTTMDEPTTGTQETAENKAQTEQPAAETPAQNTQEAAPQTNDSHSEAAEQPTVSSEENNASNETIECEATQLKQEVDNENDTKTTVVADIPAGAFHAHASEITMEVKRLSTEDVNDAVIVKLIKNALTTNTSLSNYVLYDVVFKVNGVETEPLKSIDVNFKGSGLKVKDTKKATAFYFAPAKSEDGIEEDLLVELPQREDKIKELLDAGTDKTMEQIEDEFDFSELSVKDEVADELKMEVRKNQVYGCYVVEDKITQPESNDVANEASTLAVTAASDTVTLNQSYGKLVATYTGNATNIKYVWYRKINTDTDTYQLQKPKEYTGTNGVSLGSDIKDNELYIALNGGALGTQGNGSNNQSVSYYVAAYNANDVKTDGSPKDGKAPLAISPQKEVTEYYQLQNGSFETPKVTDYHSNTNNWQFSNENYKTRGGVWQTTGTANANTLYSDSEGADIEIVTTKTKNSTGQLTNSNLSGYSWHGATTAVDGTQFAELNCQAEGSLYQDVLTTPGETLNYQFSHRARGNSSSKTENDTMSVVIMPTQTAIDNGVTTQAKVNEVIANPTAYPGTMVRTVTSDDLSWHTYTGSYSVTTQGQYSTRFFFVAGNTASGNPTVGNFLDNVFFTRDKLTPVEGTANVTLTKTISGLEYATAYTLARTLKFTIGNKTISGTDLNWVWSNDGKTYTGSIVLSLKERECGTNLKVEETSTGSLDVTGYTRASSVQIDNGSTTSSTSGTLSISTGETKTVAFTNAYVANGGSGDEPESTLSHEKYIKRNDDGTYNITLNASGTVGTKTHKKNVDIVLIVDTSGSMDKSDSNNSVTKLVSTKNAIKALIDAFNAKSDTVDTRYKLVTFNTSATTNTGSWTDGNTLYDDYIKNLKADGGTNYDKGLSYGGTAITNGSRTDAKKIVIFLTDGQPTYYGDGPSNCGSHTSEATLNAAQTSASTIICSEFYAVGIGLPSSVSIYSQTGSDIWNGNSWFGSWQHPGDVKKTMTGQALLQSISDCTNAASKEAINLTDSSKLTEKFREIVGQTLTAACTNVTITDQLSQYVAVTDASKLQVKIASKDNNQYTNVYTKDFDLNNTGKVTLNNKEIATVTYDSSKKEAKLKFNDDYSLEANYYYYLTITNVTPNQKAFDEYKKNDGYGTTKGEANTDEDTGGYTSKNKGTSSGQAGFYSNATATVSYKNKKSSGLITENYQKPVIQVQSISVRKDWKDATPPENTTVLAQLVDENGKSVNGKILELNSSNNWTGSFEFVKLDKYDRYSFKELKEDQNGNITYNNKKYSMVDENSIIEINDTNYKVTYSNDDDIHVITNTKYSQPIKIIKQNNSGVTLKGAEFTLTDSNNKSTKYTSDKDGIIFEGELNYGTYTLRETKAPSGYSKLVDSITITVTKDGIQISENNKVQLNQTNGIYELIIKNDMLYSLPSTGGSGIYLYMIGGILLMFAAAWILYKNKCREVLER